MNMTIAYNYLGDMIVKDCAGQTHIFKAPEAQAIKTASYKHAQLKRSIRYQEEIYNE